MMEKVTNVGARSVINGTIIRSAARLGAVKSSIEVVDVEPLSRR
jgi:hypothetical protein